MKTLTKIEWVTKKLSDVYDIRDGTHDSPRYIKSGYPLVTSKNLKGNGIDLDNTSFISENDYININKRSKVNINDVLFAMIGTIGNPTVVLEDPNFAIKNVALFKVPENQDSKFLKYYLESDYVIKKMSSEAKGTTQKFVGLGYLRNFPIKLPPLEEQKSIVSILDDVFNDADKALEIYKTNLLKTKNIFESYLDAIFNYESVNWEQSKLGDVAELIRGPFGGSLKKIYFTNKGYAIYEQSHAIHSTYNNFRYFIDDKKYQEMKRFTVHHGDIIMSCSGTMGKTSIIPQDAPTGIINQALLLIRTKKHLLNSFLKLWMESNDFNKKLERLTLGAAIKNVASVKILKNIELCYPPLEIQKDIVKKAEILLRDCNTLEVNYKNKRKYTELLKKSVLNKAFGGEL